MNDPWTSLEIQINPLHPVRRFWQNRIPSLPPFRASGGQRYHFWPGINVGLKRLDRQSLQFVHRYLLAGLSLRRRLLWDTQFAAGVLQRSRLIPATLDADLQGDIVMIGSSILDFDLNGRRVHKYYPDASCEFLKRSTAAVSQLRGDVQIEPAGDGLRVSTPLYMGRPLSSLRRYKDRWRCYRHAIERVEEMRSQTWHESDLADYAGQLERMSRSSSRPVEFDALCGRLSGERGTVALALSHGDAKDDNIIRCRDGVYFIDWELADSRGAYHDLCNLVIHPVVHNHLGVEGLRKRLAGKSVWQRLGRIAHAVRGQPLSDHQLRIQFILTLLEKYVMYAHSGRWAGRVENCVRDWRHTVNLFDHELDLRLN